MPVTWGYTPEESEGSLQNMTQLAITMGNNPQYIITSNFMSNCIPGINYPRPLISIVSKNYESLLPFSIVVIERNKTYRICQLNHLPLVLTTIFAELTLCIPDFVPTGVIAIC